MILLVYGDESVSCWCEQTKQKQVLGGSYERLEHRDKSAELLQHNMGSSLGAIGAVTVSMSKGQVMRGV